jgi:5'(3')-deoxyribonucleotidase
MRIMMDIDGVLADFVNGMCLYHGRPNPYEGHVSEEQMAFDMETIWGMSAEEFWRPANSMLFWERLPWMPDGRDILRIAEGAVGRDNVCLLTAASASPQSAAGKKAWINANLPAYRRRYLIGASGAKQFCASPDTILIDDRDRNCHEFVEAGGHCIVVPRPWNCMYSEADNVVHTVDESLAHIIEATEGFDG